MHFCSDHDVFKMQKVEKVFFLEGKKVFPANIILNICKINKKIKKSVKNRAGRAIFHTFFDFLVDFTYFLNDLSFLFFQKNQISVKMAR